MFTKDRAIIFIELQTHNPQSAISNSERKHLSAEDVNTATGIPTMPPRPDCCWPGPVAVTDSLSTLEAGVTLPSVGEETEALGGGGWRPSAS